MSVLDQTAHHESRFAGQGSGQKHERSAAIMRTSRVGIGVNLALVAVKVAIGVASNSLAVITDAVNNLSDALSSLLIIVGTKLSDRRADHMHPYGYGRVEYITTVAVGGLVLFGGSNTLHEAVEGILRPSPSSYSTRALVIMGITVVAKLLLSLHYMRRGRALSSDSLVATGKEALSDVFVTLATIVSAIITIVWNVSTEAYVAAAISLLILKAGLETLIQAFSRIVGQRIGAEASSQARAAISKIEGVEGTSDWRLADFGPENVRGSVYVEVDERLDVVQANRIARAAQFAVYEESGIRLDAVGVMPVSCADEETKELRKRVEELMLAHEHVVDVQGFRLNKDKGFVTVDVIVDYEVENREAFSEELAEEAARLLPDYRFFVTTDSHVVD